LRNQQKKFGLRSQPQLLTETITTRAPGSSKSRSDDSKVKLLIKDGAIFFKSTTVGQTLKSKSETETHRSGTAARESSSRGERPPTKNDSRSQTYPARIKGEVATPLPAHQQRKGWIFASRFALHSQFRYGFTFKDDNGVRFVAVRR